MFTILITETKQGDLGELFTNSPIKTDQAPTVIEHAKVTVATLDIPALLALVYKTPRARRSDAGKARAGK